MDIAIDTSLRTRIQELLNALCKGLYEKEEAMRLALLSALAGESIFLLGPPGVGKSLIARRLKFAFRDGVSFEYLMSKFSTPDEIFGPVSIKKLKEEDKYERLTERYLPGANIVFLDEIWKAGPAIQNALLTILNEKIYRNGSEDMKVDIRGIITASNELPPPSQNLAPIWDRFLLRLEVGNIRQFSNFLTMIVDTEDVYTDNLPKDLKLNAAELEDWSQQIDAIEVPPEVLNTIQILKLKIEEYNQRPNNLEQQIQVFDRRWKKIIRLLRTSAFLNGRKQVDLMDCFLMLHCLWDHPRQKDTIREVLSEAIRRHGYTVAVNLQMLKREIADYEEDVQSEIRVNHQVTEERLMLVQEEYYQVVKEDNKFEGSLISTKQFRNLDIQQVEVTNFFDEDLNLRNRLKARKGAAQFTIDVEYNSVVNTYPLLTQKAERTETIFKKPHPIVEKHWEERYHRLLDYIEKQEQKVLEEAPYQFRFLEDNLFVASSYSELVKANLEEVKTALRNLKLKLEKIKYSYTSL